jgi:hypothetical protein
VCGCSRKLYRPYSNRMDLQIYLPTYVHGSFPFLKYISYPQFIRNIKVFKRTTRLGSILILVRLITNTLCIALPRPNVRTVMSRSALMSSIQLIFLSLGHYMNFVINNCGIASESYNQIHLWIVFVAALEGLIHSVISITLDSFDTNYLAHISSWTVCSRLSLSLSGLTIVLNRPSQQWL